MKGKSVNKYKKAGIWNIVCGVVYSLAYISIFVMAPFIGFEDMGVEEGVIMILFSSFLGAYLWEGVFMTFPFLMILAGTEMISKHKKGVGVNLFIIFNNLMKLLNIALAALFAWVFFTLAHVVAYACCAIFAVLIILMVYTIILDIGALFQRQKLRKSLKNR